MDKNLMILLIAIGIGVVAYLAQDRHIFYTLGIMKKTGMKIESFAFKNGGEIPSRFTCDGENINPELIFKCVPKNAKSLALIVDDPDAPMGVWGHWVIWNINPKITEINQNSVPIGAVVGENSANKNEYQGPCPPNGLHHYFFRLYALDTIFFLDTNIKAPDLIKAMEGHIIEQAELIGTYERK